MMVRAGLLSVVLYTSISLLAAGTFLAVTVTTGDYTWVARLGGAAWVFLLSLIILMPTVTPWVRKRLGGGEERRDAMRFFRRKRRIKDPVCGMEVEPEKAAASSQYKGVVYYFCAPSCKQAFDKEPEAYLQPAADQR